jgi:8-oxo-dGTP pyrophosphatase MutT (NUDIX family)
MPKRDTFCSFCGSPFQDTGYPRSCTQCGETTYRNPIPVAVTIVPVDGGVLAIRRGIEPGKGKLAFPGGYIELGESWQAAGAREIFEETGIRINATSIREFAVESAPDGTLLIFGVATPIDSKLLSAFAATDEAPEIVILRDAIEMAFSLHSEVLREFFAATTPQGRTNT